jgi:hypothetical protein
MTQCIASPLNSRLHQRLCRAAKQRGSVLVEVAVAVGFAAFLGLFTMKASLMAISNNQWIILQTLADAYLTRETALSVRIPVADLTGPSSPWPDQGVATPLVETVTVGRLPGGGEVRAQLTRYRVDVTQPGAVDSGISSWRLHSILEYTAAGQRYVKSRSTLRLQ